MKPEQAPPRPNPSNPLPSRPIRATPIAVFLRDHAAAWRTLAAAERADAPPPVMSVAGQAVLDWLSGHGASFAPEIADYVSAVAGIQVTPWSAVYGRPLGTISWSAQVDSMAAMAKVGDTLNADAKYLELVGGARELFSGLPEDTMSELVAAAGPGDTDLQYVAVVTAVCADGHRCCVSRFVAEHSRRGGLQGSVG